MFTNFYSESRYETPSMSHVNSFYKLCINFLNIIIAFLLMDNSNVILVHISIHI